jgi:hypothetical protein
VNSRFPWSKKTSHRTDPYWDFFINTPAADLGNTVTEMIRKAPDGNVFPVKSELHTPEITTRHVKGMAEYFGAALTGVVKLDTDDPANPEGHPYAVVCAVSAEYDPRTSPGIGGQVPVQNGLFITFVLSAWIRELGFRATRAPQSGDEELAARAGLGTLDAEGHLVTPQFGGKVYIANAIRTDLPLAPDG